MAQRANIPQPRARPWVVTANILVACRDTIQAGMARRTIVSHTVGAEDNHDKKLENEPRKQDHQGKKKQEDLLT